MLVRLSSSIIHHRRYPPGPCHTPERRTDTDDDTLTELGVLVGFGDDLAGELTRINNRIRWLANGIHPALERVLGPRLTHRAG